MSHHSYVLGRNGERERSRRHECRMPHCDRSVAPWALMCSHHWEVVPPSIKRAIEASRPKGHERPSRLYAEAVNQAITSIMGRR